MRHRRRYVAFESAGAGVRGPEILRALGESIPAAQLKLIAYDRESKKGLIRCGHLQLGGLKATLLKIGEVGGKKVSFKVLDVSGTIKAAKRKFFSEVNM